MTRVIPGTSIITPVAFSGIRLAAVQNVADRTQASAAPPTPFYGRRRWPTLRSVVILSLYSTVSRIKPQGLDSNIHCVVAGPHRCSSSIIAVSGLGRQAVRGPWVSFHLQGGSDGFAV